jgi:hypothetical protein
VTSAAIQGRLQTLLQALATFADEDVTLGDWLVLDRGSAPYAVIWPGPFEIVDVSGDGARVRVRWQHNVDVVADWDPDGYTNITAARAAVMTQLLVYPSLNGLTGIQVATLRDGGEIREIYAQDAIQPSFHVVTLIHICDEELRFDGQGEFV